MKYVCEACERLVEPRAYGVERGALQLVCPRCEGTTVSTAEHAQAAVIPLPLRADAPSLEVVPPPEVVPASERCPKCASPKRGRSSCAKCGLVFALYAPQLDAALETMRSDFTQVLEHWGTPEAQQVIDRAGVGRLGTFARLCRHHLADYPEDSRASALLQLLHERSVALTLASSPADEERTSSLSRQQVVLVAALVMVIGMGGAMAFMFSHIH